MHTSNFLSLRVFAGLIFSLAALATYAGYTATQISLLRSLQTGTIDSDRGDSLLLIRVQNDFNLLGWRCATCIFFNRRIPRPGQHAPEHRSELAQDAKLPNGSSPT